MDKIEPTNKTAKYILEDVDYLFLQAIRDLTFTLEKLRSAIKR